MIYLASPFFNEEQLNTVMLIELALEEAGIPYFSPRSEGVLIDMTPEEREKAFEGIYLSNIQNMNDCDVMVANIDDRDTGTTFEIGYMTGRNKPVLSYSGHDYQINVMLRQSVLTHNTNINNLVTNLKEIDMELDVTQFSTLTKDIT